MKLNLSVDTRLLMNAHGLHLTNVYQTPRDDGRKLKRCTIPSDPWHVTLCDHSDYLQASRHYHASGATADAAVRAAIPFSDLRGALGRLGAAMDDLATTYRRTA